MKPDRIALKLNGAIPLNEYAEAILHFSKLVEALSDEVVGKDAVTWDVTQLSTGSAFTEIQGYAEAEEDVYRVTTAYDVVAKAIQQKTPIPYSFDVIEEARLLTSVINGHIKSIEMQTGESIRTITEPISEIKKIDRLYSIGTVTGRIETLTRRRYTFTLYDSLFDQAVKCHLRADQEEIMRDAWGKIAAVGGEVYRDPESGRPLEVRNVRFVEIQNEEPVEGYLVTRGIWSDFLNEIPSEQLIRNLRDAN